MTRVADCCFDRRRFLGSTAAGLGSAAAGIAGALLAPWPGSARAAGGIAATDVADGLSLLSGAGGNVLVLATDAGRVVIDSGAAIDRDDLLATIDALPGERIAALFNTHWHPDQVGANVEIGRRGATIHAHVKTRQRLGTGIYLPAEDRYQPPLAAAGVPTETFFVDGKTAIGGRTLEYAYLIEAHTDGDIYVAIPELDVIAVGDVLAPDRDPVFDWFGGGWLGGRVDALARLLELGGTATRFVPSFGPVVGRAEVQAEYDWSLDLFERMVEHIRLGETPEDMLEAGILDGLARRFDDPSRLLYDLQKGFWANHNKLMHDIV